MSDDVYNYQHPTTEMGDVARTQFNVQAASKSAAQAATVADNRSSMSTAAYTAQTAQANRVTADKAAAGKAAEAKTAADQAAAAARPNPEAGAYGSCMSNYASNQSGTMPDSSQQEMLCHANVSKHFVAPPPEDIGAELLAGCLFLCTAAVGSAAGVAAGAGMALLPAAFWTGALSSGAGDIATRLASNKTVDPAEVAFMMAFGGVTGSAVGPGLPLAARFLANAALGGGGSMLWSDWSGNGTGDTKTNALSMGVAATCGFASGLGLAVCSIFLGGLQGAVDRR